MNIIGAEAEAVVVGQAEPWRSALPPVEARAGPLQSVSAEEARAGPLQSVPAEEARAGPSQSVPPVGAPSAAAEGTLEDILERVAAAGPLLRRVEGWQPRGRRERARSHLQI